MSRWCVEKKPVRKTRMAKLAIALACGFVIALMVAIVVVAWIKGGVQPGHMVEIPVNPASLPAGGA